QGGISRDTKSYLQQRRLNLRKKLDTKGLDTNEAARLREELREVEKLLQGLPETAPEKPPGPAPGEGQFEVIRLRSANAAEVASALEELFNGKPQKDSLDRRLPRVRIVAEPSSNCVLVQGSAADLATIRYLVEKSLDSSSPHKK